MKSRREPCESCRKHHVKCDDIRPKCTRCQKSGRECIRPQAELQFVNSTSDTPTPQLRLNNLEYIDETPSPISHYTYPDSTPPPPSSLSPPQLPLEEACLLRYFIESLARWFDLCDSTRHFTLTVPHRARSCPPLLNAILSASARHFSTLPRPQQLEITHKYGLPHGLIISEEATLNYHSRCIAYLLSVNDANRRPLMDENLLAAAVILRFYEELDSPFIEFPNETAVQGLQIFIKAQAAEALSPRTTPSPPPPPPPPTTTTSHSTETNTNCDTKNENLRQAAFWAAFRQELHMAISRQRPFRIPLEVTNAYLPGESSPDYAWTNRLLVITARIVDFCFGPVGEQSVERFEQLVRDRDEWVRTRPGVFGPIYSSIHDPSVGGNEDEGEGGREGEGETGGGGEGGGGGGIFPIEWYTEDAHVVAAQTLSLASILLDVYNPRTPRLGWASTQTGVSVRNAVKRICGVGVSNRQSPTALLTASIAIVLCAAHFENEAERKALMWVLIEMKGEYNYWPAVEMQRRLAGVWDLYY